MSLDLLVQAYGAALRGRVQGSARPDDVAIARAALLGEVARALRSSDTGGPVLGALRDARRHLADVRRGLSAADLAFEEGSLDAAAHILQEDPVAALALEVRQQARSLAKLHLLRVLREHAELAQGELAVAARMKPSPAPVTPSEEQTMSRRIGELRGAGLVFTVQAGQRRLVRLTPAGRALLEHVEKGHLPDAGVTLESVEIPEARLRPMIQAFADHPHLEECADNRLRYCLLVGGLYVMDDLMAQARWDNRTRIVANLLWQHPLADFPYGEDLSLFQRMVERWPTGQEWQRDLIQCLYRLQVEKNRGAALGELHSLYDHIEEGSPWLLLWAPASIAAASWAPTATRQAKDLLQAADDRLRELADVPLALHLRAFVASMKPDRCDDAVRHWEGIRQIATPRYGGRMVGAIARASTQFLAAAPVNALLTRIEQHSLARIEQVGATRPPDATSRPAEGAPRAITPFLEWVDREALDLTAALAEDRKVRELHEALLEEAPEAVRRVEVAATDFAAAAEPYLKTSRWIRSQATADPRRRTYRAGGADFGYFERVHRNNADGRGLIATRLLESRVGLM